MTLYSTTGWGNYSSSLIGAGTVIYIGLGGRQYPSTEALAQLKIKDTLTGANLYVYVSSNGITAASTIYTRIGGVNGSPNVSIGSSATGAFTDLSDSDSLTNGNLYNLKATGGGSGSTLTMSIYAITLAHATHTTSYFMYCDNVSVAAGATSIQALDAYPVNTTTASEVNAQFKIEYATVLTHLRFYTGTNTSNGTSTITLRANAVGQTPHVSVGSGATGSFDDDSDSYTTTAGDLLSYSVVNGGSSGTLTCNVMQLQNQPTANATWSKYANSATSHADTVTTYYSYSGRASYNAVEALMQQAIYGNTQSAEYGFLRVSANTVNSGTSTFRNRVGGSNGTVVVSVGFGATGFFEDTSDSDSFTTGTKGNWLLTVSGTGGAMTVYGYAISFKTSLVTNVSGASRGAFTATVLVSQIASGAIGNKVSGKGVTTTKTSGAIGSSLSETTKISAKAAGSIGDSLSGTETLLTQYATGEVGDALSGVLNVTHQITKTEIGGSASSAERISQSVSGEIGDSLSETAQTTTETSGEIGGQLTLASKVSQITMGSIGDQLSGNLAVSHQISKGNVGNSASAVMRQTHQAASGEIGDMLAAKEVTSTKTTGEIGVSEVASSVTHQTVSSEIGSELSEKSLTNQKVAGSVGSGEHGSASLATEIAGGMGIQTTASTVVHQVTKGKIGEEFTATEKVSQVVEGSVGSGEHGVASASRTASGEVGVSTTAAVKVTSQKTTGSVGTSSVGTNVTSQVVKGKVGSSLVGRVRISAAALGSIGSRLSSLAITKYNASGQIGSAFTKSVIASAKVSGRIASSLVERVVTTSSVTGEIGGQVRGVSHTSQVVSGAIGSSSIGVLIITSQNAAGMIGATMVSVPTTHTFVAGRIGIQVEGKAFKTEVYRLTVAVFNTFTRLRVFQRRKT